MDTTTIHLPLNKKLKKTAEKQASELGYSSLQEVLRVFLTSFSQGNILPTFTNTIQLTPQQENALTKRLNATKKSTNKITTKNLDQMFQLLKQ